MLIQKKSNVIKHFLVLSDLHFISKKKSKDKNDHYQDFQKAFLDFLKEEDKVDYVLVAGDLTDKNDPAGYKKLKILLSDIAANNMTENDNYNNPIERIVFCPGNHDQDRGKLSALMRFVVKSKPDGEARDLHNLKLNALLDYLNTKDDSYDQLSKIHKQKFRKYLNFVKDFYPESIARERMEVGFTLNFGNLLITSLNSSWFCDYPDKRLKDDGHLILGKKYVEKSFLPNVVPANQNSSIPRITIMHHPPENLVWQETYSPDVDKNTMQYITNNSSLVISGHVHGIPKIIGYDKSAFLISNGTSYNTSLEMSFVMFELNLFSGQVTLRKYRIEVNNVKGKMKFNIENDKQSSGFQRLKVPLTKQERSHSLVK